MEVILLTTTRLSHKQLIEKIRKNLTNFNPVQKCDPKKGKTYEEYYGQEDAKLIREKMRDSHLGQEPGNKGKPSPFKNKTYEEIGRGPSPLLGRERPQEDRDKISKGHLLRLGKDKPSEERDGPLTSRWREQVKKRDNYTCQCCGVKQEELLRIVGDITSWLHAHHIKSWAEFPELRFEVSNGITLCWPCHLNVEGKQISCPEPPLQQVKVKNIKTRGKTLEEVYGLERAAEIKQRLRQSHLGKPTGRKGVKRPGIGGRKKGSIPHNKGKTNIEIYGVEKAKQLSLIAAENARVNRNRLGTGIFQ